MENLTSDQLEDILVDVLDEMDSRGFQPQLPDKFEHIPDFGPPEDTQHRWMDTYLTVAATIMLGTSTYLFWSIV